MTELIPYPEFQPTYTSRFTINMAQEAFRYPDPETSMFWVTRPTGRRRLIVEGEQQFVDRVYSAMAPTIAEIKAEIETAA